MLNDILSALADLPAAERHRAANGVREVLAAARVAGIRERDDAVWEARALWPQSASASAAARGLEVELSKAARPRFVAMTQREHHAARILALNGGRQIGARTIKNIWISKA